MSEEEKEALKNKFGLREVGGATWNNGFYQGLKVAERQIGLLRGCPHVVNWTECILVCKKCYEKQEEK